MCYFVTKGYNEIIPTSGILNCQNKRSVYQCSYVLYLELLDERRVGRPPEDAFRLEAVRATEEVDALEHDGRNAVVALRLEGKDIYLIIDYPKCQSNLLSSCLLL